MFCLQLILHTLQHKHYTHTQNNPINQTSEASQSSIFGFFKSRKCRHTHKAFYNFYYCVDIYSRSAYH